MVDKGKQLEQRMLGSGTNVHTWQTPSLARVNEQQLHRQPLALQSCTDLMQTQKCC
jgi:hypothetical protein